MEDKVQKVKVLNSFFSSFELDGLCGSFIEDSTDDIMVYLIVNLDWLQEIQTKPEFVVKRMRIYVAEQIEKFTGLKVYVGSTAKRC
jgi:hypothetical protein